MNDEEYDNNVWPINASLENVRANQPFVELASRYMDFKKQYERASTAYETAHLEALHLELNDTSTPNQLEAATRREQHYAAVMARMQENMREILNDLGVSNEELESRYKHLTTNISFANNPRYRNLRAALRNLYPNTAISNDDLEALIRGNVNIPNNSNENNENTRAKKSRARNTLAAVRGGKLKSKKQRKSRHRCRKSTAKRAKY